MCEYCEKKKSIVFNRFVESHLFCECDECFREYRGPLSNDMRPYYLKSEADKVIIHQKYKRCLAMYRYCAIKALYELDFKGNDVKWKWYSKWMHKWYNLAKKFKEAK